MIFNQPVIMVWNLKGMELLEQMVIVILTGRVAMRIEDH